VRARAARRQLAEDALTWLDSPDAVLAFRRADGFSCVVNFSSASVPLSPYDELILASGPLDGGRLPPDTAAWLAASGWPPT
jgi:alpha-glucosidase